MERVFEVAGEKERKMPRPNHVLRRTESREKYFKRDSRFIPMFATFILAVAFAGTQSTDASNLKAFTEKDRAFAHEDYG